MPNVNKVSEAPKLRVVLQAMLMDEDGNVHACHNAQSKFTLDEQPGDEGARRAQHIEWAVEEFEGCFSAAQHGFENSSRHASSVVKFGPL